MANGSPYLVPQDPGSPLKRLARISLKHGATSSFSEDRLQEIVDRAPDILPVRDFYPAVSSLSSLGREIPLELSERRGYVDNLLVTDEGHLVLIETKLWRNPESLREVVAQVLEYAMAVSQMALVDLEAAIRKGDARGNRLRPDESIAERVFSSAATGAIPRVAEDFEDALERFRQSGELLVLIVADGIQASTERLTQWLNRYVSPTSPIRFGLVELRFFETDVGQIVVPRTLLRTRELSRHVIVVDVRAGVPKDVSVSVRDNGQPGSVSRLASGMLITKDALLTLVAKANTAEVLGTVKTLVEALEGMSLASRGTRTTLQFGLLEDASFLGIVAFADRYIWCQIPSRLRVVLGPDRFVQCKRILNSAGAFYRAEDVDDPDKVNSLAPRYDTLVGREPEVVQAIANVIAIASKSIAEVHAT